MRNLSPRSSSSISKRGRKFPEPSAFSQSGLSHRKPIHSQGTMDLYPDFKDLLAEFVHGNVRFVVIGGYAVGHHGRPRATKDLALLISRTPENLEQAAAALTRFGAPPTVVNAIQSVGGKRNRLPRSATRSRRHHVPGRRNRYGANPCSAGCRQSRRPPPPVHFPRRPSCQQARFRTTARPRGRFTASQSRHLRAARSSMRRARRGSGPCDRRRRSRG